MLKEILERSLQADIKINPILKHRNWERHEDHRCGESVSKCKFTLTVKRNNSYVPRIPNVFKIKIMTKRVKKRKRKISKIKVFWRFCTVWEMLKGLIYSKSN